MKVADEGKFKGRKKIKIKILSYTGPCHELKWPLSLWLYQAHICCIPWIHQWVDTESGSHYQLPCNFLCAVPKLLCSLLTFQQVLMMRWPCFWFFFLMTICLIMPNQFQNDFFDLYSCLGGMLFKHSLNYFLFLPFQTSYQGQSRSKGDDLQFIMLHKKVYSVIAIEISL